MEIGGIPFPTSQAKASRAEALEYYRKVTTYYNLNIRLFQEVNGIDKEGDHFKVSTKEGEIFYARNVVIAIGYFDTPHLLHIPGENLPNVSHYFDEPFKYSFTKVVLVGGGNSAIEAALELYRHDVDVTIVHRDKHLSDTAKPWLLPTIHDRINENKIGVLFQSEAESIEDGVLNICNQQTGEKQELPVDFVFILVGFLPDKKLLQSFGVDFQEGKLKPTYNPGTFQTNVQGLYLAGTVVVGNDTDEVMIEKGREHSKAIINNILSKQKRQSLNRNEGKWHVKIKNNKKSNIMKIMYSSEVTSIGGLYGHVTSENGALDIDVFMPTGTEPDKQKGTTPEQLFAASYAACLEGTIYHVAKLHDLEIDNTKVLARIKAVQIEKGDVRFALDLKVSIPETDKEEAQKLLNEAYKNCPLTKATDGKMEVNVCLS